MGLDGKIYETDEASHMFFSKNNNDFSEGERTKIKIQWGGYYSFVDESGGFMIFRLLDFNKDAYQAQLFKEKFSHAPTFEEARKAQPYILHVPIAIGALLNHKDLTLIGHEKLNDQDLEGYRVYLEEMGANDSDINDLMRRLIGFSNEGPADITLIKQGDQVLVSLK